MMKSSMLKTFSEVKTFAENNFEKKPNYTSTLSQPIFIYFLKIEVDGS